MNLMHLIAGCLHRRIYSIGIDAHKRKWFEQSVTTFLRLAGSASKLV